MRCTHCGGTSFDEDRARADLICLDCGMVASENVITSEVEFMETSTGQAAAVGRFVSDESQVFGNRESKQVTENKARRRIDTICGQLRLGGDVSTSAFRYYQSALFRGFTRGRGALQVAAGCIYLAARQLRINLMLLDLSDAVGVNVYMLGRCYTELKRRLHLSIPEMDPCLYIERFASQLELGDKTPVVATTAMRLLQRMKRDWISTGRRPSGLTAAALLVAARIHEFNRNEEDVARIARISQQTTRKRLEEFSRTPSSALSIDAFFTVDYEDEQDPPAFSMARKPEETEEMDEKSFERIRTEIQSLQQRIDVELEKIAKKRGSRGFASKLSEMDLSKSKGVHHLLDSSTDPLKTDTSEASGSEAVFQMSDTSPEANPIPVTISCSVSADPEALSSQPIGSSSSVFRQVLDGLVEPALLDNCVEDLEILTQQSGQAMCQALSEAEAARCVAEANRSAGIPAAALTNAIPHGIAVSQTPPVHSEQQDKKSLKLPIFIPTADQPKLEFPTCDDGSLPLDEIDDEELDHEYILRPKEVILKAAVWYKANAEYLQTARKRRMEKLQQLEEAAKHPNKKKPRRRTTVQKGGKREVTKMESSNDPSADGFGDGQGEERLLSSKINYAALEAVVGSAAAAAADQQEEQVPTTPVSAGSLTPGPLLASTLVETVLPSTSQRQPTPSLTVGETGEPLVELTVTDVTSERNNDGEPEDQEDPQEELSDENAEAYEEEEYDDDDDLSWQQGAELW